MSKNYNCIQLLDGKILIKAEPKSNSDLAYHDLHLLTPGGVFQTRYRQDNRRRTFSLNGPLFACLKNNLIEKLNILQQRTTDILSEYAHILPPRSKGDRRFDSTV